MLAWSHGTVGLQEKCQPSTDPNTDIFGTQPHGLGAVGYGSASAGNLHQGQPQDGVLQTAINRGWTVTATDYFAGGLWPASQNMMPYFVATMSGAAVLDSARAAAQVLAGQYGPALKATSYDVLTWGWSQGGHAAFWAAQLGRGYYAHTAPKQFTPALKVVGTAVVAPGSTFVAGPHDPQSTWGTHWFDREMHQTAPMTVGAKTVTFSLGVPLFGNYMSAWPQWSRTSLAAGAGFPAYPAGAGDLSQDAILTQQGIATTNQMLPYCFDQQFPFGVPYSDAAKNAYFVQPIWGQPGPNGQYQGQLDKTCNTTTDSGIKQWCSWLLYNEPGPAGTSSYDKVPLAADGSMLPVFIGQGEDDLAVHCINTSTSVPVPADCLSRQLYDQLSGVYCSNGSAKAALQLHLWRATQSSPAEHNDIPGLVSDNGHLAFSGSPLDEFMSAALAGTGPPAGCNASVANP